MWKNIVEPDGSQMTLWFMPSTGCIIKVTDSHPEYVIYFSVSMVIMVTRTRLYVM